MFVQYKFSFIEVVIVSEINKQKMHKNFTIKENKGLLQNFELVQNTLLNVTTDLPSNVVTWAPLTDVHTDGWSISSTLTYKGLNI